LFNYALQVVPLIFCFIFSAIVVRMWQLSWC